MPVLAHKPTRVICQAPTDRHATYQTEHSLTRR